MSNPIPVAVVGAGNMGAHHVRVYDELPEADLVEVVEPDSGRAAKIRNEYQVQVYDTVDEIEEAVAASVAVPNAFHRNVAETLLEQGLDLLIEKPLAPSVSDAVAMVKAAEARDSILQVGHIERFNPAVELLGDILETEEVIAIEAHRLGPFNEQLSEESVIFDLMIHDLDIIRHLMDTELDSLNAIGTTTRSQEIDHAVATMKSTDGILGTATASHVTHGKVRRLDVTTKLSYIQLDYQEQSIEIHYHGTEQLTRHEEQSRFRTETVVERPFVTNREPLKNELEHFLSCVRTRKTPFVPGPDGVATIGLAENIVESLSGS
jgi:predicted dehydrogenase